MKETTSNNVYTVKKDENQPEKPPTANRFRLELASEYKKIVFQGRLSSVESDPVSDEDLLALDSIFEEMLIGSYDPEVQVQNDLEGI